MLDRDLAGLYGVTTMALNQAVKRNQERFPDDFVFRLTRGERDEVITICDNLRVLKFSPSLPNAFPELLLAPLPATCRPCSGGRIEGRLAGLFLPPQPKKSGVFEPSPLPARTLKKRAIPANDCSQMRTLGRGKSPEHDRRPAAGSSTAAVRVKTIHKHIHIRLA